MGSVPAAAWDSEELSLPCPREEFIAAFAHFHPDIRRVVEAATEVTVMPICDRERDDRWSGGRIVLLGDACHPVRPYMAAGGAMAVEDAAILGRCLATIGDDDPAEAFRCYEATRIPRVARGAAHLPREQLDARADRGDGLVLLLRCLPGAAHAAGLNEYWGNHEQADDARAQARSDDCPRPRRLRRVPAASGLAGRRAYRRQLQPQHRGRRRVLARQRRCGVRGHAQRHRRRRPERPARAAGGVGVRIRQPPRRLAPARHLRRALGRRQRAGRRARAGAEPRAGQGLREPRARDRQPRLSLDRLWRGARRGRSASTCGWRSKASRS